MRSTFQPKRFGFLSGSRSRELPLWRDYPPRLAEALRSLADSPAVSFATFGDGKVVFPRVTGRAEGAEPLRVALFGGFDALGTPEGDGDGLDVEAALRLGRFPLALRTEEGLLGLGIEPRVYPVANPLAFTDPAEALSGWALRSRLWRGSRRADAYYLERELGTHEFHLVCIVDADPAEPASIAVSRPLFLDEGIAPTLDRLPSLEIAAAPWQPAHSLVAESGIAPAPLEVRINYPLAADPLRRNLLRLLVELLREYRAFLSYGENL